MKPRGAFSMYAPQETCGVVFDVKAIVPCRGFCVLSLAFAPCPPPEEEYDYMKEMLKLRKENDELRKENLFLKKAAAFFAKEID